MSEQRIGSAAIVASLMLSIALLGGAWFVSQGIHRSALRLRNVAVALTDLPRADEAQAAARPGRPDPARRYEVDVTGAPRKGGSEASVTIVEFSDFQCPFCGRVNPTLARISEEYGDEVEIVFKHLPLGIHPKAPAAHAAAEAAHRQGRFWQMHDRIFAAQREMSPEKYREYAEQIGLDLERYDRDVASDDVRRRVEADAKEAAALGVTGTPAFFVNGRFLSGAQPFDAFKRLIEQERRREEG